MTDDKIAKDTARDPEREALGRLRGGLRATAKKAVRKVAKKSGQKRATKKTATAAAKTATSPAAKTTTRGARSVKRADKPAPAGASGAVASGTAEAKPRAAPSGTAKAASGTARAPDAAPPSGSGSPVESLRPPGPMHPGAALHSVQEHAGGFGSLLALWGPLIIVGFLVLVFRGGDENETTEVAAGGDTAPETMEAESATARGPQPDGGVDSAAGDMTPTVAAVPPAVSQGAAEAFDGGFAMRTSMAGPSVYAGRTPGTGMPAGAPRAHYPPPPGPYRDPRYGVPSAAEIWSADGTREWIWSAEGPAGSRPDSGGDASVQWVRCAPPYYWCPAPDSPAW